MEAQLESLVIRFIERALVAARRADPSGLLPVFPGCRHQIGSALYPLTCPFRAGFFIIRTYPQAIDNRLGCGKLLESSRREDLRDQRCEAKEELSVARRHFEESAHEKDLYHLGPQGLCGSLHQRQLRRRRDAGPGRRLRRRPHRRPVNRRPRRGTETLRRLACALERSSIADRLRRISPAILPRSRNGDTQLAAVLQAI